jgi:hypothetical protein
MNTGWVKTYREMWDHWLWQDKPFAKGQAWIDLIMKANHNGNKVALGVEVIPVERGAMITSIDKLAKRWGWSRHKVSNFLNMLEMEHMIEQKRDNKKTIINIVNYSKYQDDESKKGQQKDNKRTSAGHQKDTNKNFKNEKNVKKEEEIPSFIDPSIWKDFVEMRNSKKKPLTERACQQIWNKLKDTDNPNYWLEQSIENCWTTVYPKEEQKSSYVQLWDGSARVPRYLCIKTDRGWEEKSRVGEPSHLKGE